MAVYFDSTGAYVDSKSTLNAKIAAWSAIIDALTTLAASAVDTGNFDEYSLDDGQTKIRTKYRSVDDIFNAIRNAERMRNIYIGRRCGRVTRLVDGKNFIN